jgi:hypothetical protein
LLTASAPGTTIRVAADQPTIQAGIDAAPHFRTRLGFDCVLWPGSPCIDSGADDGVDWSVLSPQYALYNGPAPDMGACGGPVAAGWLE